MSASEEIKAFARKLGFDDVGIAAASPIPEAEKALREWIGAGLHGQMKYLEDFESRLARLREKVPAAKSLVVLAANYGHLNGPTAKIPSPGESPAGRVARYAWGKDYHLVFRERLGRLEEFIRALIPGARAAGVTDTQPVFERSYGEKAGLGFRGRQGNLLSREFGPWILLAEILTDAELAPDPPRSHGDCGTCTACVDLCPTGAILDSGRIDARKCISYLTIEYKGVIAPELRPLMKDWVFGCDECLSVCPYTRFSRQTHWPEFAPAAGAGQFLELIALFDLRSNGQYEKRFRETPLLRANRKMLLRNAAVVLGNLGDARAVPVLTRALKREAALVRGHAAWALGRIGGEAARVALEAAFTAETDAAVRKEIESALAAFRVSQGVERPLP